MLNSESIATIVAVTLAVWAFLHILSSARAGVVLAQQRRLDDAVPPPSDVDVVEVSDNAPPDAGDAASPDSAEEMIDVEPIEVG